MGKGGGGPSQSTSYQTNIPEYARPYVETMMGATQQQLFKGDKTADGGFNITGFQPYKAYGGTYDESGKQTSYDPSKAVAGFSDLEQQAQRGIAGLKMPGEYDAATMGTLGSMGGWNTNAANQYMSPYIEAAMAPQLREAQRTSAMQGMQQQAEAVGRGGFGGSRDALMRAERERNLNMGLGDIRARGYQTAYEQGASQFNQDMARRMQGAGQLASIGGQRLGAEQGIYNAQSAMGAQQRQLEQQKINQAMQDYANAQQYPMMQLGFMSNMLRGLPMQAVNTQQYTAMPNLLTQGIGAAGTGAMLYNAYKKEGGQIKEYDVGGEVESDLEQMDTASLQKYLKESQSDSIKRMAQRILRERAPGMAGGGIIAFSEGSEKPVGDDADEAQRAREEQQRRMREGRERRRGIPSDAPTVAERFGAAASDVLQAPFRAAAEGVGRPPASYTPAYDAIRVRDQFPGIADPLKITKADTPDHAGVATGIGKSNKESPPPPPPADTTTPPPKTEVAAKPGLPVTNPFEGEGEEPQYIKDLKAEQSAARGEANLSDAERLARLKKERPANKAAEDYRAQIMAERANSADEARRERDLRMAAAFADMATRPGSTLVAMTGAIRDAIPGLIEDARGVKKANRELDKIVYELNQASRNEELGLQEKAYEQKMEALKRLDTLNKAITTESGQYQRERLQQRGRLEERRMAESGAQARHAEDVITRREQTAAMERSREQQQFEANARNESNNLQRAEASATAQLGKQPAYVAAVHARDMPITPDSSPQIKEMQAKGAAEVKRLEDKVQASLRPYRQRLRAAEARAAGISPEQAQSSDPLGLLGD